MNVRRFNDSVYDEIVAERVRAHEKHGDNSAEVWPFDHPDWLAVLVEEVDEVGDELEDTGSVGTLFDAQILLAAAVRQAGYHARRLCDDDRGRSRHAAPAIPNPRALRAELIQVAAMATAWIDALDRELG